MIWTSRNLDAGRWYGWNCGPGEDKDALPGYFFRRERAELFVAGPLPEGSREKAPQEPGFSPAGQEGGQLVESADIPRSRYVIGKEEQITLSPLLPDRPVVLFPQVGRKLPPGKRGTFTFRVPLHGSCSIGAGESQFQLFEFPLHSLTSTWFGDLASGELCYGLSTLLRTPDGRDGQEELSLPMDPLSAQVRLHLMNASKILLDFSKICIHVEHLSLYRSGGSYLTNDIHVIFSGADQVSQVRFGKRAPKVHTGPVEKIAEPRVAPETNFIKRSFSFLKSLTDI